MRRFVVTPHSHFAVIRHVGRRSGKPYETPIIAVPWEEGFCIALTYGPEVDWYRNVLAAGGCGLFWHGREYALDKPEPLDRGTALLAFPQPLRGILRMRGTQDFVSLKVQSSEQVN